MSIGEVLRRADRVQRSTLFRIVASLVVVVLAAGGLVTYVVAQTAPTDRAGERAPDAATERDAGERTDRPGTAIDASARALEEILEGRRDAGGVALGVAAGVGVALVVIWLGLGLTYLSLLLLAAGVAWPLSMVPGMEGMARLLAGVVALSAALAALLEGARVLLSPSGPVTSIARVTLAEAVRLKLSLVFIVLLVFALAWLPSLLNPTTPLRYRVQSFLQYGTGGTFWLLALLTLSFSVATVAFDQRNKTIWQTITKPVSAWQYLLGKWLGVVTLNAVLLAVSSAGVFLFTEHLRGQPALGEDTAYVATGGVAISEDRLLLETQVLTARSEVEAAPPELDPAAFNQMVDRRVEEEARINELFRDTPEVRAKVRDQLYNEIVTAFRSIAPGEGKRYLFPGLGEAKARGLPLTLRYRVDAGSNRPDQLYRITLVAVGGQPIVRETGLGFTHTLTFSPGLVGDDGVLVLEVYNADMFRETANPDSMSFPKGGLSVSYPVSGFRANYLRVVLVLWVKLAFLAMLGVAAATFLSFPVACLVAFGTFFAAEGAGFLADSLEYYASVDSQGNILFLQAMIRGIAGSVAWLFRTYADLQPTAKLVDGRLVSWSGVGGGAALLALWTLLLFAGATAIFRGRELATYSGR